MNAVRAEAFNLLLCLGLGAVVGSLLGFTLPRERTGALSGPQPFMVQPYLKVDQDAGVQAMQDIENAKQRRFALFNNLTRLAMTDLPRALALLPADGTHDAVLRDWITQRLARTRPDLAAQAAEAMRDVDARAALMTPAVFAWHDLNAPLATGWLRGHMDDGLARQLVGLSMSRDPGFVGRVLFDLKASPVHQRHFRDLLQSWALLDNAEALRFVEMLPAEQFVPAMVEGVGGSLLALPPESVKAWLRRLPDQARATVIEDMTSMLPSSTTLANASQRVRDMAPLASGSEAVTQWFATLVQLAPEQAQQALDTMDGDATSRDACVVGCVAALGVRDRALALDWTLEMTDQNQRFNLAQQQWLAWLQENRTAAAQWLKTDAADEIFTARQRESWARRYHLTAP